VTDDITALSWIISFKPHDLIPTQNRYTQKQQALFELVGCLHKQGFGCRKIAGYLNNREYNTHTGKTFQNSHVQFILKRNQGS